MPFGGDDVGAVRRGVRMGVFALAVRGLALSGLTMGGLTMGGLALSGLTLSGLLGAAQAQALRPAVGTPLKQALGYYQAHSYAKAMAAVRQADAASGKTSVEILKIEQMRAAIANASGDNATAVQAYTFLINSGEIPESQKITLIQALAGVEYRTGHYAQSAIWADKYFRAGGTDANMRVIQIQSYYQGKDYANAARLQQAQIQAESRRGAPAEEQLQLLYRCQLNLGQAAAAFDTIKQLVTYYPKPDYWQNVIAAVRNKPGFADRLQFDLLRFEFAIGLVNTQKDAMELAELAIEEKLAGEAQVIVDKSYAGGLLGVGPEAPRHQRLKDLVARTAAAELAALGKADTDAAGDRDGNRLAALGEQYVSFGKFDTGIPMIEAGLRKDQLRHPDDTKLHLGIAYYQAGQKAKALAELRSVGGTDGAADLAGLWVLHLSTH